MVLPAHFVPAKTREEARALFASSVKNVEIEVFTYCNRTCWFCPNAEIDRRSANHYMDEALYLRILNELAEIGYEHTIAVHRYNEPLADRIVLERLRQARRILPGCILSMHTNGDYLTREYLDELRAAGLNRMSIMNYLGNNEAFSDTRALSRLTTKAVELGLRCEFTLALPGVRYDATLFYPGMAIQLEARNYAVVGTDRGKLVQLIPYKRTSWCPVVFEAMYIDWNGKVMPCCNLRSDAPSHQAYIVDDLSTGRSIFEAWASSDLFKWRRSLFNLNEKQAPCDSCHYALMPEDPALHKLIDVVNRAFLS